MKTRITTTVGMIMPKNKLDRRSPTPDQLELTDRLLNPRNTEDLNLALKIPGTPAFKDTEDMLAEGLLYEFIIQKLIDKYLDQEYKASKEERELILKQLMIAELAQQKFFQESQLPPQWAALLDNRAKQELQQVLARLEEYTPILEKLNERIETLTMKQQDLQQREDKNTKNWTQRTEAKINHYMQQLQRNNVSLVTANGTTLAPNSPQAQTMLAQAFNAPPPVQLIQVLANAYQQLQAITPATPVTATSGALAATPAAKTVPLSRFIPTAAAPLPPPPPPPNLSAIKTFSPAQMEAKADLMAQIRLLGLMAEEKKSAIQAFLDNKNAFSIKTLDSGAFEKVKVGEQKTHPFSEAIQIYEEKKQSSDELIIVKQLKEKVEKSQAKDLAWFKQQTGADYQPEAKETPSSPKMGSRP